MKKALTLFLVASILFCTAFAASASPEIVASGTCGDNLTWTLDDAGTLTISGTGEMYDYYDETQPAPWYTDETVVKKVIIENGVTSIGTSAFRNCSSLESVTIPDSITTIGDSAFMDCGSLTEITIPDSVTSIEGYAFANCSGM